MGEVIAEKQESVTNPSRRDVRTAWPSFPPSAHQLTALALRPIVPLTDPNVTSRRAVCGFVSSDMATADVGGS
jgi:hypothetical protein